MGRRMIAALRVLPLVVMMLLVWFQPVIADDAFADNNVMAPEEVFLFAEELRDSGDFSRAATEYRRYVSYAERRGFASFPHHEQALYAYAVCLEDSGETDRALRAYADFGAAYPASGLIADALLRVGAIYERGGDPVEAEKRYGQLIDLYPAGLSADLARLRLARIFVGAGRDTEAMEILARVGSAEQSNNAAAVEQSLAARTNEEKSPLAAGVFSAVLPGAGHAYVGRPRDALFAFLSNGLLIAAAVESFDEGADFLGGVLTLVELGWYSGTIHGAVSLAHRYNMERKNEFLDSIAPYISNNETGVGGFLLFSMNF